ncbi:hypothetical protein VTJ49DRAFT_4204 [Mycothermus thermophilus]|uniref:HD/PDEase domain-containing protein n=1 Tax=Humicola insolens TaxID=85995 RepID=A0ABR3V5W6_HUMIN
MTKQVTTSSDSTIDPITEHGWTAVPVDSDAIFQGKPYLYKPSPVLVNDIHFPSDDPLVARVQAWVKEQLPWQTYHHSMRVFYFATAILHQQFPTHTLSPSTLALTSLLHDIGTAPSFLTTTRLSFDFYGGILALDLLSASSSSAHNSFPHPVPALGPAPQPQAEAVCEAIIRHQDLGGPGTITLLGQILQLATIYDNVGHRPYLVHEKTRDDVNRVFPRGGWGGCFAETVRREVSAKPWAHSTHIGGKAEVFANAVAGNLLMEKYE